MKKDVMLLTGAGQIGMAIARRLGSGMKIVVGDKNIDNAKVVCQIMITAGYDCYPFKMDISRRESIKAIIAEAQTFGEIKMLVNAAVSHPVRHLSRQF